MNKAYQDGFNKNNAYEAKVREIFSAQSKWQGIDVPNRGKRRKNAKRFFYHVALSRCREVKWSGDVIAFDLLDAFRIARKLSELTSPLIREKGHRIEGSEFGRRKVAMIEATEAMKPREYEP